MPEAAVIELITMLEAQPQPSTEQWYSQALCAQTDPDAFYPEKGGSTAEAKKICLRCPVKQKCLQWALDHDERFGIWGGLSDRERRRLARGEAAGELVDEPHQLPAIAVAAAAAAPARYDDQDARLAG
jgi:WhiB family redox-sensing transcriptional regulator